MEKGDNPYEILGVSKDDADLATLKKAYRKLALKHHPDKQETEEERAAAHNIFAKLSAAYEVLTDPVKKYDYDQAHKDANGPKPPAKKPPADFRNFHQQQQQQQQTSAPTPAPPAKKATAQTHAPSSKPKAKAAAAPAPAPAKPASSKNFASTTPHPKPAPAKAAAAARPMPQKSASERNFNTNNNNNSNNFQPFRSPQPPKKKSAPAPPPPPPGSSFDSPRRSSSYSFKLPTQSDKTDHKPVKSSTSKGSGVDTSYSYAAPSAKPKSARHFGSSASCAPDTSYSYAAPAKPKSARVGPSSSSSVGGGTPDTSYSYAASPQKPKSTVFGWNRNSSSTKPRSKSPMSGNSSTAKRESTPYAGKPMESTTKVGERPRSKSPNPLLAKRESTPYAGKPIESTTRVVGEPPFSPTKASKPRVAMPYSGKPHEVTRVEPTTTAASSSSSAKFHDPYEVFNRVMAEEFGADYKKSNKSGWNNNNNKKKDGSKSGPTKKTTTKNSSNHPKNSAPAPPVNPNDPDAPVSISTSTKTIQHDDGRVEVKTITKILRQDGSIEKVVQSSIADSAKDVAKLPDSNTSAAYSRPGSGNGRSGATLLSPTSAPSKKGGRLSRMFAAN
jgi:curved DNA-binding protein CbpA